MFKQLSIIVALCAAFCLPEAIAQQPAPFTASIDCINHPFRIQVSNMPPVNSPTPLWIGDFKAGGNPCRKVFWGPVGCGNGSNTPLYYLDKYNFSNNQWEQFKVQNCPTFDNLPHGTWRVRGQNLIEMNGSGCEEGHIMVYNVSGQWIGYRGTYTNAPIVATSNIVVTGPTQQNEIAATYVETYGTLDNALFNFDEIPKINTTGTVNYESYWIAIFEKGGQNRFGGQGWTPGFIPNNEINLKTVWNNAGFADFEPITSGVTYHVQFAIAGRCNPEWVESGITNFGVCPEGILCKGVFEESKISLSPNPANSTIRLAGLVPNSSDSNYHLSILDIGGRVVKEFSQVNSEEMDVSDLPNGLYGVRLLDGERQVKTFKLSIVH